MPERFIQNLRKKILPEWKVCFISALIIGLITHLYKITNWLPNWDSFVFRYDAQNMLSLGRWFLSPACALSSFYDLPFIAGLMTIIFHALGAVCICSIFKVKKKITSALIGAFVVSFPTVTSVMMYNYVADGYAIAFLFACMAAMYILKEKPSYIASVVLIALSVGIYQAYITVTIVLILMYLIFELIYKTPDLKKLIFKALRSLLIGALGMGIYYLIFVILLKVTGTEVIEYQGFGRTSEMLALDIRTTFYNIKHSFLDYFFDFSKGISAFSIINVIITILTAILYITDIIKNKLGFVKIILVCFLSLCLPVGAMVLYLVNSDVDYHNLMKMGYFVFYLFLILQYEKDNFKCEKFNSIKLWTVLCVISALIFNYVIIANVCYHKLTIAYENSYGTLVRIADRIEQTEGSEKCDSVLVLGHLPGSDAYSVNLPPEMTGATDAHILRADDEIVGQSVFCSALNDYCKKNYKFLAGDEKDRLIEKIDDDSLGNWPAKDSVSVIEDVIVIKLADEE